ncbi:MAG: Gfo/Idh/MocA family oxidoreductase [Acidobacteriota bacterium]
MTRCPQVAIVGAGLMGRWHARACRRAGGRVTAVVDIDPDAARRLAAACGGAATAISLEALPSGSRLDVIHVCTPIDAHAAQVRAGLSRGAAVIVEKPLAPSAPQTEALLAHARACRSFLVPVHQTACQDGFRRAARWLNARPPRAFDYRACSAGAAGAPERADEIAAEILPHPLALLDVLLPDTLAAIDWWVDRPAAGELLISGVAARTAVRFLISMHARPPRHELMLFTDEQTVTVDLFHGFAWRERGDTSRGWKVARPFAAAAVSGCTAAANLARRALRREPAYPGLVPLVRGTYEALADPDRRPFSDRHTLDVARARDRILQRISRG